MDDYPHFVIKGIPPYDGEYEWDTDRIFNTREWRYLREIGGYLPATLDEGMKGDDPSLYVALAVCCMVRARRVAPEDAERAAETMVEAPWDNRSLTLRPAKKQQEDDPLPLESTSQPGQPSPNRTDSSPSSTEETESSSGLTSTTSSAPSDDSQSPTGTIESDTPAVRPLRWAN